MTDDQHEDPFAEALGPTSHADRVRAIIAGRRAAGVPDAPRLAPVVDLDAIALSNQSHALAHHVRNTPIHFAGAVADHPAVLDWTNGFLRDPIGSPWLLLLGDTGAGKTHQAYGALRTLALSGRTPIAHRATTAAELYASQRPGGHEHPEAHLTTYMHAPLLLLDDLGAARITDFTDELTLRLIDYRYAHRLGTIITSNVKPEEFSTHFGPRTTSRLIEKCRVINFGIDDRRRAGRNAA